MVLLPNGSLNNCQWRPVNLLGSPENEQMKISNLRFSKISQ
jgi:hypothetical protein